MRPAVNGADLQVEVLGLKGTPVLVAHHGAPAWARAASPRPVSARWLSATR